MPRRFSLPLDLKHRQETLPLASARQAKRKQGFLSRVPHRESAGSLTRVPQMNNSDSDSDPSALACADGARFMAAGGQERREVFGPSRIQSLRVAPCRPALKVNGRSGLADNGCPMREAVLAVCPFALPSKTNGPSGPAPPRKSADIPGLARTQSGGLACPERNTARPGLPSPARDLLAPADHSPSFR